MIKQYTKFLSYLFLVILLITPKSFAKDGFGEVKFSSQSYQGFLAYLRGDGDPSASGVMMTSGMPVGFAINQKGNNIYYMYCPKKYGDNCMPGGHMTAQSRCTTNSKKKGNGRCFVFAKGRVILWDSVNIKIPKKVTAEQVREIFKENGWY